MKTFLKIIGVVAVIAVLGYAAIMYFSSGARNVARDFLMLSSTGNHEQARAFLHQSLQTEESSRKIVAIFDGVEPYTEISFSGVSMSGGSTILEGTALTDSGCASKIEMEMIKEQITFFNISPLCR